MNLTDAIDLILDNSIRSDLKVQKLNNEQVILIGENSQKL